jgi:hypothetical protein
MVYQGKAENSLDYFEKNFNLVCPEHINPADYLIDIIHSEKPENVARY